ALVKTGGEKPEKSVENQINAPIPVGLPVPLLGRTLGSSFSAPHPDGYHDKTVCRIWALDRGT
ncbi:MAG: hypothetical protein ACI9TA_001994, partial [Reinekea sp.]